jgi:hypothetical protein
METSLIRLSLFAALLGAAVIVSAPVHADGRCDLNSLVGYQVLFAKPITGYIQGGLRKEGYIGCEPDRVLVFADNTGLRCKTAIPQTTSGLPTAYLFAKNIGDMKLCVESELLDVSQTN